MIRYKLKRRRCPLNWPGSKVGLLDKLIPHFAQHTTFVDVFGGGGAVSFCKPRSQIEIWNDLDWNAWNVFRCVKDKDLLDSLIFWLSMTNNNIEQYRECIRIAAQPAGGDPLTRAWAMVWGNRYSFNGRHPATCIASNYSRTHRNAPRSWPKFIGVIGERFAGIEIENRDFAECIQQHDSPSTFFFCDPPYVESTLYGHDNLYAHTMSDDDHVRLLTQLRSVQGSVMLCGYQSALYAQHLPDWRRLDFQKVVSISSSVVKPRRVESIWMNYSPAVQTPERG